MDLNFGLTSVETRRIVLLHLGQVIQRSVGH